MVDPKILFEDEHTLVIDKPAGLLVHPDGTSHEATLVDWVIAHYPSMKGVGEEQRLKDGTLVDRPGIVHRLDRETSGALLLAKTHDSYAYYKKGFQERTIRKTYLLFVHGVFKEKDGVIDRSIGKSKSDFRRWSAERGARGVLRDALTEYRVLEEREEVSLVEAHPRTGRTHQIRVHFKAINHPLLCDRLYAPKRPCLYGFERCALHSYVLEFKSMTGEEVIVRAPVPGDFLRVFDELSIDREKFV